MKHRMRRLVDHLSNRIFVLPLALVVAGVALSWLTLRLDGSSYVGELPDELTTTAESARTLMSTIAGGLIASVTLLLSLVLVAVQLSNAQYSPRTLRKWTGDRMLQSAIGTVLGAAMFCLLVLRNTGRVSDNESPSVDLVPHFSVLVGLALGLVALIAVLKAVDHLTDSLRIGSVVKELTSATLDLIDREANDGENGRFEGTGSNEGAPEPGSHAVEADRAGYVTEIDVDHLHAVAPEGSRISVEAPMGSFVLPGSPLLWIDAEPDDDLDKQLRAAVALDDTRSMHADIGFGVLQLVDIALRALSPGVNDPNTAVDVVRSLSVVLARLWQSEPPANTTRSEANTTVTVEHWTHDAMLRAAYSAIVHHSSDEPIVRRALCSSLTDIRSEVDRLQLVGGTEILDRFEQEIGLSELTRS